MTFSKHITHYGPELCYLYNNMRVARPSDLEETFIHNLAIGQYWTALGNESRELSTVTNALSCQWLYITINVRAMFITQIEWLKLYKLFALTLLLDRSEQY